VLRAWARGRSTPQDDRRAIAAGRCIRIAAEVGENEHGCLAGIFGLALNHLPNLGAEPIGTLYRIHIERISACVRDINIVQSDPEQTGRELMHQLPGNVDRKFVWAAQTTSVGGEIRNRELQHLRHLLQLLITYAQCRRINRALIVVAQQMIEAGRLICHGCGQQALGQDHAGT
jgi:hypothetical protein